jgi:hypothetical protein
VPDACQTRARDVDAWAATVPRTLHVLATGATTSLAAGPPISAGREELCVVVLLGGDMVRK